MMMEQQAEQEVFQSFLENLYNQFEKEDSLQKVRMRAWDHYQEIGLPNRRDEVFRYIRLKSFFARPFDIAPCREIDAPAIASHILPECSRSVLVFINGHFSPTLSKFQGVPKRAVINSLNASMYTFGSFLNNQLAKAIKEETDPFAIINTALHRDGVFIYLPPKTVIESPIQVLNIVDVADSPAFLMPRVQLFIGSQSQLSLISTQAVLSGKNFTINMVSDLALEEEAHVKFTQIPTSNHDQWQFNAMRATMKRNSSLKTVAVTEGAGTIRQDYRVVLTGENAEVSLNGVAMLAEKRESHVHVLVDHQAPYCRSMQLFKNALTDVSRSSFEGKILVRQAAQKTEAFQLNNNLLLSDRANADSKPNLEIFADDVKASHGSTVGQLDKEQLFYMKTRGFNDAEAKNLLVYGFCEEVIDLIDIPSIHDHMQKSAQNFLLG